MNYKVYKTDEDGNNPVHLGMDYSSDAPKRGNQMNGMDAFGAPQRLHLVVPEGEEPAIYAPSKHASVIYEGVEYKAVAAKTGDIPLDFDGSDSIADVVAAWNAANEADQISHDSQSENDVPSAGSAVLRNGDVYHLVRDTTMIAEKIVVDKTAQILADYEAMKVDVLTQMAAVFGTNDPASATAYSETWKEMSATPSDYSGSGLTARVVTGSFAEGDALDDDTKVADYANECILQAKAYGVFRMARIQQFRDAKAVIMGS